MQKECALRFESVTSLISDVQSPLHAGIFSKGTTIFFQTSRKNGKQSDLFCCGWDESMKVFRDFAAFKKSSKIKLGIFLNITFLG